MSENKDGLNICLMNDSFPPVIDGVATTILNYAEIINEKLGKATVVTPEYPGVQDDFPFPVVRYPSLSVTERYAATAWATRFPPASWIPLPAADSI